MAPDGLTSPSLASARPPPSAARAPMPASRLPMAAPSARNSDLIMRECGSSTHGSGVVSVAFEAAHLPAVYYIPAYTQR